MIGWGIDLIERGIDVIPDRINASDCGNDASLDQVDVIADRIDLIPRGIVPPNSGIVRGTWDSDA